jgi:hypothetical protein
MPQLYHDDGDLNGVSSLVVVGANGSHDPARQMPDISQLSMPHFPASQPPWTGAPTQFSEASMQQNGIPLSGFAMLQHNNGMMSPVSLPQPGWPNGADPKFDKDAQPIFADQIGHRGGGYPAVQLQTDQLRSGRGSSTDQRSHNDESSGHSGGSGEGSGNSAETVNQSQAYQAAMAEDPSFQQAHAILDVANGDPAMLSVLHAFAGMLNQPGDDPNMAAMGAAQLSTIASSMMMQHQKPGTPNPWPDAHSAKRGPGPGAPGAEWMPGGDPSSVLRAVDNEKVMKLSSLVGKNMSEKQYHHREADGKADHDSRQPRQPTSQKRYGPDMWCVELNRTIVHAMQARKYDTLIRTLPEALPRMDGVNLVTLLYQAAKNGIRSSEFNVRFGLSLGEIRHQLERNEIVSAQSIGNACYGLHLMTCEHPEVRGLVATLAQKIEACPAELNCQALASSLYGLQGMSSQWQEVRALIAALTPKVEKSRSELNPQAVSNAMYGLRCMTSDWPEVRQLANALANKVWTCKGCLSSQHVGSSLYGLQGMSNQHREVRKLMRVITQKVREGAAELDPQAVGTALYGIQSMQSDCAETLELVSVLAEKVDECVVELDPTAVGNAIFGLQGLSSDAAEVRNLVRVVAKKVRECRQELRPHNLCNALYGMKSLDSKWPETRALIAVLAKKVKGCTGILTAQQLSVSLVGLQNFSSDVQEVRALVAALAQKIKTTRIKYNGKARVEIEKSLGIGLQNMEDSIPEVKQMVIALAEKM